MEIQTALKKWREKADLSQSDAASQLGITQPSFSRYETGKSQPDPAFAIEIEKITGIGREKIRPDIFGDDI